MLGKTVYRYEPKEQNTNYLVVCVSEQLRCIDAILQPQPYHYNEHPVVKCQSKVVTMLSPSQMTRAS